MTEKEEMEHEKSLIKEKMKDLVFQILNSSSNSTEINLSSFDAIIKEVRNIRKTDFFPKSS